METSTLIALSRQGGVRRQLDIVANNIANMNTTGFKGEKMMFTQHLVKSGGGQRLLGPKLAFTRDIATMLDTSDGPMEKTGNSLDLGINGEGYFVIQTENGERYTRNGHFQLDDGGQLVNQNGDPLLSTANEPLFLSPEDTEIAISRDGTVSTNNGDLGRIRLVGFENPQNLKRGADGLFNTDERPKDIESPEINQGMLEGSNVKPIFEMARMITIHRSYDNIRNFIKREDERMRNMVKELGRT